MNRNQTALRGMIASLILTVAGIAAVFAVAGCATTGSLGSMTSAQAIALAQPVVSGGLALILQNNPSYIPAAQKVGSQLAAGQFSALTTAGVNAGIASIAAQAGATASQTAIITASFDAGLLTYLEAVGESDLQKDPNAVAVLQDLGQAIQGAATIAAANPK